MAKKPSEAAPAAASVKLKCYYAEAMPGDVVEVDAEEAARLIELGVADDVSGKTPAEGE